MNDEFHRWYCEEARLHNRTTFMGVSTVKCIADLWNYQELICQLRPTLIVEAGTAFGGSALYFAEMVRAANLDCPVLTIDPVQSDIADKVRAHAGIELLEARSVDAVVAERVCRLREDRGGPMLVSLDSLHKKRYVLEELLFFRPLTRAGDYLVVEDGNINGHPVLVGWGAGPHEALEEYMLAHPGDYERDQEREEKFGITYAPRGYLKRVGS